MRRRKGRKMTIDEAISHALEVAERQEHLSTQSIFLKAREKCAECAADHRQLAEWLTELKDLREENKVLMQECDRLIKEKGELLSKVSGGDVLRICQLEEQLEKAKRLLKAAVEDINFYVDCYEAHCDECCCSQDNHCHWKHEAEALKLIGEDEDENS